MNNLQEAGSWLKAARNIEEIPPWEFEVTARQLTELAKLLELRKLLQEKLDTDIERQDYIDIVRRVQKGFLKGVQTNIRMRIAAEWVTNLKMFFTVKKYPYSRERHEAQWTKVLALGSANWRPHFGKNFAYSTLKATLTENVLPHNSRSYFKQDCTFL